MRKLALSLLFLFPNLSMASQTILWLPHHSSAINDVLKIIEANENLRITIALDQISPAINKRIKALEAAGRVEIALRIPHDPLIPLLYYPNAEQTVWDEKPAKEALPDDNPYFMGLRIGLAMENARKQLRRRPVGLVLPPGALIKDYFPLAKGIGIKWLASGAFVYGDEEESNTEMQTSDEINSAFEEEEIQENFQPEINKDYTSESNFPAQTEISTQTEQNIDEEEIILEKTEPLETSIAEVNGIKVLPFTAYKYGQTNEEEELLVFDETAEANPARLRKALKDYLLLLSNDTRTAGDLASNTIGAEVAPEELAGLTQPWTENFNRWASKKSQLGALVALSQTRVELMKYLNSKGGSMKASSEAFNSYFKAEDSRRFLNLGSDDIDIARDTEIEMLSSLANIYRIMDKNPPQWALSSLTDAGTGNNTARMRVSMKNTGFEIRNEQTKPNFEKLPENLPEAVDPDKLWKLNSLKVDIKNTSIQFRFTPAAINNSGGYISGFSHIAIDLYIDINNRVNAGSTKLLPGRPMKLYAENGWEYALEISPNTAYLYRSTNAGAKMLGKYRVRVRGGAITVYIPKTVLKGTPSKWGYAALMLVPNESNKYSVADTLDLKTSNGVLYTVRPSEID